MSEPSDDPAAFSITATIEGGTMRIKASRAMEADMLADVIRAENRGDPVEAGRQIWIYVAPVFRELGWNDERIVKVYRIPPEVLSGEADRRARVWMAEYRLTWIEREPSKYYVGEAEMVARLRRGEISVEVYAEALPEMMERRRRELEGET